MFSNNSVQNKQHKQAYEGDSAIVGRNSVVNLKIYKWSIMTGLMRVLATAYTQFAI